MICKHMDESGNWENLSFENAVKYLVKEKNPLIESLINKLEDDKNLRNLLYNVLFLGQKISYNIDNVVIENAAMYGFISRMTAFLLQIVSLKLEFITGLFHRRQLIAGCIPRVSTTKISLFRAIS